MFLKSIFSHVFVYHVQCFFPNIHTYQVFLTQNKSPIQNVGFIFTVVYRTVASNGTCDCPTGNRILVVWISGRSLVYFIYFIVFNNS